MMSASRERGVTVNIACHHHPPPLPGNRMAKRRVAGDMNLYCDNYSDCNEVMFSRGAKPATVIFARAKGWHIYDGNTIGGAELHATLGPQCVGAHRRALAPPPPLRPGQIELFEIEAWHPPEGPA